MNPDQLLALQKKGEVVGLIKELEDILAQMLISDQANLAKAEADRVAQENHITERIAQAVAEERVFNLS